MTPPCRTGIALAFAACVAGCAAPLSTVPSAIVTSPRAKLIPADRMKNAVVIGKSTRTDVLAALGETLVISFDNGYEVWLYRVASAPRAEFVILFAPSGLVAKTRMRPGQPA